MVCFYSKGMVNRIMDLMPNLRLVMEVTPRRHLQLEDIPNSNSSMALLMPSQHQVCIDKEVWVILVQICSKLNALKGLDLGHINLSLK